MVDNHRLGLYIRVMPIAEHLKDPLEVIDVDKFAAEWAPQTLFEPYHYRCFIKEDGNFIKRYARIGALKKQLSEFGEEHKDWIFVSGKDEDQMDQVYVKQMTVFLRWKMKDSDDFKTWIDHVECHNPRKLAKNATEV